MDMTGLQGQQAELPAVGRCCGSRPMRRQIPLVGSRGGGSSHLPALPHPALYLLKGIWHHTMPSAGLPVFLISLPFSALPVICQPCTL